MENEIRQKNDERLAKLLQEREKKQFDNTHISNPGKNVIQTKSSSSVQNPYILEELPDVDIMNNTSRLYHNQSNKQVNRKNLIFNYLLVLVVRYILL